MLPGTVSAAAIPAPLQTSTPAHTLGRAASTAPTHMASNSLFPLAYWYGHAEIKRNPLLLDRLIRNLGENVWDRLEDDAVGKLRQTRLAGSIFLRATIRAGIGYYCGHAICVRCQHRWKCRSSTVVDQGMRGCLQKSASPSTVKYPSLIYVR